MLVLCYVFVGYQFILFSFMPATNRKIAFLESSLKFIDHLPDANVLV